MWFERSVSFFGIFVLLFLSWLLSNNKRIIPWKIIFWGTALQLGFALFTLKTHVGQVLFQGIGDFFTATLSFVDAGAGFVFGHDTFTHHFFAFKVLPTIIFFSSLMSVLYYLGIMQRIVYWMALVMQRLLRTSGAETLATAANVFIGQTEAPLVIRPYIESMTTSELMTLMVGGFATVAGGVLAAYVGMGIDAGHLVTASVISAPATLVIAKLIQPEVDKPKTLGGVKLKIEKTSVNILDAAATGAADGVKLAINVAAMMIAFLALIAMLDSIVGFFGHLVGFEWSLSKLLGYLFAPLAWIMGVESQDILKVGELLGIKMVGNEFIAYERLGSWLAQPTPIISKRSEIIATYALCGFANFGSIGIQIGGIGPLAPSRRHDLARIAFRAMLGGTLAAFMTACIAGIIV